MTARLERARWALACPACRGDLSFADERITCSACDAVYPIRNNKLYFRTPTGAGDALDSTKSMLKRRLGRWYYSIGVRILAPTFPVDFAGWVRRYVTPASGIVVDAGCGNNRLDDDIVGVDTVDYDEVDIVCDLEALPFRDGSVDAFVSRSVLEHVPQLDRVLAGFERCTRPGGYGIHMIPFLYPFHASPSDYRRFTDRGHEQLFPGWQSILVTNPTGPISTLLLLTIEFLSSLLGFGWATLQGYVYLALCGLLFPLKFLDAPFVHRRRFAATAASILSVSRKPELP